MKVIVFGGSGFLGSHVVDVLIRKGYYPTVVDPKRPHRKDVVYTQSASLRECDALFYLAGMSKVESEKNPVAAFGIAVWNLLQQIERLQPRHVVYASSVMVYECVRTARVEESDPIVPPRSIYAASKLAGELACMTMCRKHSIPYTICRFGTMYGPRAHPDSVIEKFIACALRNEPLPIEGSGFQMRQFVPVWEAADVVVSTAEKHLHGTFNICEDDSHSLISVVCILEEIFGVPLPIDHIDSDKTEFELPLVDTTSIWTSPVSWESSRLKNGLKKYVDWRMCKGKTSAQVGEEDA